MTKSKIIFLVILISSLIGGTNQAFAYASKYSLPSDSYEGLFQFQYRKLINTSMVCIIHNDSVYVPFKEIFSKLQLYYEFDFEKQYLHGFYIKEENKFEINFNNLKAVYKGQESNINPNEFLRNDLEIYVLPSFIRRTFNLNVVVSYQDLLVYIQDMNTSALMQSEDALPILQKFNRSREHDRLLDEFKSESLYPLIYDRELSFLNGGLMDYDLNFIKSNLSQFGSGAANLGLQVLGGDLNLNTFGFYEDLFRYQTFANWNFHLGDNQILSQVKLGSINNFLGRLASLPSVPVNGVMITNQPIQYNPYFDNYVIEDVIKPGWQVELYVNNKLFDFKNTGSDGSYKFEIPLYYGMTFIEVKVFGPKGEKESSTKTIYVPHNMIPTGELSYSLTGGFVNRNSFSGPKLGDLKLGYGINRWATIYTGVTQYEKNTHPDILTRLSLTLSPQATASIDVDPMRYLSAGLFFNFQSLGSYLFNYQNFKVFKSVYTSESPMLADYNFTAQIPELISWLPMRLNLRLNRRQFDIGGSNVVAVRSNMYFGDFRLSADYNLSFFDMNTFGSMDNFNQGIRPMLTYVWRDKPEFLKFLDVTTFSVTANYDITYDYLRTVRYSFSQSLFSAANVVGSMMQDYRSNFTRFDLGLIMNLDVLRTNSQMTYTDGEYIFTQNMSGGAGYDSYNEEFYFADMFSGLTIGTGSAVVRFFLDDNANGKYDNEEQLIPNVDAKLSGGGRRMKDEETGQFRYIGLQQYGKFNVTIDEESFPNPLWVAMNPSFSFIADPNSTKIIDVPCYSTGVVEGSVMRNDGELVQAQAGVKVHIMKRDSSYQETLPVFSDGTFYKAGIPPGDYLAWVDSAQVSILNVKPVPEMVSFSVEKTTYGDFVEGLNFELFTQEAFLAKADNGSLRRVEELKREPVRNVSEQLTDETAPEQVVAETPGQDIVSTDIPVSDTTNQIVSESKDLVAQNTETPSDTRESVKEEPAKIDDIAVNKPVDLSESKTAPVVPQNVPTRSNLQIFPNEKKLFGFKNNRDVKATQSIIEYLDAVSDYMKSNPGATVEIVGHSDNFGPSRETQEISDKRAELAGQYLISKGISKSRVFYRGEGDRDPIASNTTDRGRQQNRRIEIRVME